jgi:hypothetical protein
LTDDIAFIPTLLALLGVSLVLESIFLVVETDRFLALNDQLIQLIELTNRGLSLQGG